MASRVAETGYLAQLTARSNSAACQQWRSSGYTHAQTAIVSERSEGDEEMYP